jgi:hypothetical protein
VGAAREVFEESAILLGAGDLDPAWREEARRRVHGGKAEFRDVIMEAGLRLDLSCLVYFARWVTPEGAPRRYDTRFFATAMPAGQEASPAPVEVERMEWLRPKPALAAAERGEVFAMPPTRVALSVLEGPSVAAVLARLARERNVEPILPRIRLGAPAEGPGIVVALPGEPGYEEAGS